VALWWLFGEIDLEGAKKRGKIRNVQDVELAKDIRWNFWVFDSYLQIINKYGTD